MNMCQIDFTLVFIMIPFIDVRLWLLLWDYHKERMWLERKRCWRLELFFSTPFNLSPTEIRKNPFINWTPIALRYKTREKTESDVALWSEFLTFPALQHEATFLNKTELEWRLFWEIKAWNFLNIWDYHGYSLLWNSSTSTKNINWIFALSNS